MTTVNVTWDQMEFREKKYCLQTIPAIAGAMLSSRDLCVDDACICFERGDRGSAMKRLDKAAQYAWGFWRPEYERFIP